MVIVDTAISEHMEIACVNTNPRWIWRPQRRPAANRHVEEVVGDVAVSG